MSARIAWRGFVLGFTSAALLASIAREQVGWAVALAFIVCANAVWLGVTLQREDGAR